MGSVGSGSSVKVQDRRSKRGSKAITYLAVDARIYVTIGATNFSCGFHDHVELEPALSFEERPVTAPSATTTNVTTAIPWQKVVSKYQNPNTIRSSWEIVNSIGPYIILWYLMWRSLSVSYLLTFALSLIASGFLMRTFIIFHDCGHGSFFNSRKANRFWGIVTGILVFTPFDQWTHEHAMHHASSGDLDRRGLGDVWTLTAGEYMTMPPLQRLGYYVYRNPFVMFGLGAFYMFVIAHRKIRNGASARERNNVWATTIALLLIAVVLSLLIGIKAYLLIQLPIIFFGGGVGVYLFYMQHQFEDTYWERHKEWDYAQAALEGSSYYKMPKVFQWFTGNIGIHHIHHLSPRIPNYRLQACQDENPMFQEVEPLTFKESLEALWCHLYDEENRCMTSFATIHRRMRLQAETSASLD